MLRTLLAVYGALSAIGGVLWIAIPGTLLGLFGVASPTSLAMFQASLFGGAGLAAGAIAWLARDAGPSNARNAVVLGLTVLNAAWFVLTLLEVLRGDLFNQLAWLPVIVYGVFTGLFVWAGRSSMAKSAAVGAESAGDVHE